MHPEQLRQVNQAYEDNAASAWAVQLRHALSAAHTTKGKAASYWCGRIEILAGRLAIAREGRGIDGAIALALPYLPKPTVGLEGSPEAGLRLAIAKRFNLDVSQLGKETFEDSVIEGIVHWIDTRYVEASPVANAPEFKPFICTQCGRVHDLEECNSWGW